jgi:hypothetical protein
MCLTPPVRCLFLTSLFCILLVPISAIFFYKGQNLFEETVSERILNRMNDTTH